jgi:hypothetical protein
MQILRQSKLKKLDLHSIFRLLSSKKNKISVNLDNFDLNVLVEFEDVKNFILAVNPYFDFQSRTKIDYYRSYYIVCNEILQSCQKLMEEAEKISYYCVRDLEKNRILKYSDLNDDVLDPTKHAIYSDLDEVKQVVENYMLLFNFLQIEKNIEIQGINSQDVVIERLEIK